MPSFVVSAAVRDSRRIFKSAWFTKAANKARIKDAELCAAVYQAIHGQAMNLGGGVFKKRLNNNMHRAILLAKGDRYWVCEYLFAKKDRDNIDDSELAAFRQLAKRYEVLTRRQMDQLVQDGAFVEICDDDET